MSRAIAACTLLALLTGCADTPPASVATAPPASLQEPAGALAGTAWQLVHFRSSEAAIGTVVPPRPERYRLHFGADGALAAQLDCNRATARWGARPASATEGALSVTPGAMTRAMCGPDALDTRIARDFANLRSYSLQDGRLSLALQGGAGTYLWAPAAD